MTLVICPGCRHPVSAQATACPQCGCPLTPVPIEPHMRARLRRRYRATMIICLLVIFVSLAFSVHDLQYLAFVGIGLVGFGISRAYLKGVDR